MATLSASDCASNHNTAAPMCTQTHYLIKKKPRRISEKKLDNLQRNVYVKNTWPHIEGRVEGSKQTTI